MNRRILLFVLGVVFSFFLHSQELIITSESELDWQKGTLEVAMTARAPVDSVIRPDFLHRAQKRIDSEFPNALFNALLPLRVDSLRLVQEIVRDNPTFATGIADLARKATAGLPQPAPDMSLVRRDYTVPIFPDFVGLFIDHEIPFRMEEVISWVPTTEFTGVVIYAADPIPLRGTGQTVYPAAALLPEIYDQDLRPVLEQDMLDPQAVRQNGVVAYTASTNEDPWRHRIGGRPLRIMAREVYGIHPTDLIIGVEDANRLLATAHNRNLLRQGRILVVLHPSRIRIDD